MNSAQRKVATNVCTVYIYICIGKTIINHPFGNGLYHLLYLW